MTPRRAARSTVEVRRAEDERAQVPVVLLLGSCIEVWGDIGPWSGSRYGERVAASCNYKHALGVWESEHGELDMALRNIGSGAPWSIENTHWAARRFARAETSVTELDALRAQAQALVAKKTVAELALPTTYTPPADDPRARFL